MVQQEGQSTQQQDRKQLLVGWFFFFLFASFVAMGIIVKRVFNHAEFMMMFHLPAAVFLVIAAKKLTLKLQQRYRLESEKTAREFAALRKETK